MECGQRGKRASHHRGLSRGLWQAGNREAMVLLTPSVVH